MGRTSSRRAAIALALVSLAAAAAAPAGGARPTPGAPGLGDRVFPLLGNGGYDVQHYLLDLRYASADPTAAVHGTVTITARATQDLSRFDLDWSGGAIGNVTVDGRAARWSRDGGELVVTPPYALADGHKFSVQVADF